MRVLKEIAILAEKERPSETIKKCFYVDNFSGGSNTLEEAKEVCTQLNATFDEAKFNLRKFASNAVEVLSIIPDNKMEKVDNDVVYALGFRWNTATDKFVCNLKIKSKQPPTKRELFSQIAMLYNPVDWLAPIMIKTRILMQNAWKESDEWYKPLPNKLINQ